MRAIRRIVMMLALGAPLGAVAGADPADADDAPLLPEPGGPHAVRRAATADDGVSVVRYRSLR